MNPQKIAGLTRADKNPRSKPQEEVRKARERAQRLSLTMVRRLENLTDDVVMKGPKCPTCHRGTLREENLRLKAILGMLTLAAVAGKPGSGDEDEAERGPVLVFPPGSRIAVAVTPAADERGVMRQPVAEDDPVDAEVIEAEVAPVARFPLLRADAARAGGAGASSSGGGR